MAVQYRFLLADISVIVMNSVLSVNISCHDISAVVLQFLAVGTGRSGHDQQKRSIPLFNVGNYEREERKGTSGTFVEKTLKLLPPVTLSSSAFYTPVSAATHPIAVLALEKYFDICVDRLLSPCRNRNGSIRPLCFRNSISFLCLSLKDSQNTNSPYPPL